MVPPPQDESPLAATVLGTLGTVLWCIQLLPQMWQNWRTKRTEGLPISMMILWSACGPPLGVYCIVQNFNIPVQVQPQIFTALSLVTNAQILVYHYKWTTLRATIWTGTCAVVLGVLEFLLVLGLKAAYKRGIQAPTIVMGALTVVLLLLGFVPLYMDMAKRQGRVIGVNFFFLGLDSAGSIFSLASLAMQTQFDILGGFNYISILTAEVVVYASHAIWCLRFRGVHTNGPGPTGVVDDEVGFCYGTAYPASQPQPQQQQQQQRGDVEVVVAAAAANEKGGVDVVQGEVGAGHYGSGAAKMSTGMA